MDPYLTSLDHVLAELERVDLLIRLQVLRARRAKQGDDPFQGLYISEEEVDALIAGPAGLPRWARTPAAAPQAARAIADIAGVVAARRAESVAQGVRLRLPELERLFGVSSLDVDVLLICLAPELDLRYERLFAYLQDDVTRRRPSVDLVLNLLSASLADKLAARERFASTAPLIRHRLVDIFDDPGHSRPPLLGRYLKVDERIVGFLLGSDEIDPSLAAYARCSPPGDPVRLASGARDEATLERAVAEVEARGRLVVHVHGPRGVGKRAWAEALAGRLDLALLVIDGEALGAESRDGFASLARRAAREAALQGAALYVSGFDALLADDRRAHRDALLQVLAERQGVVVLAGSRPWEPETDEDRLAIVHVELPRPDHAEREKLWARHLADVLSPDAASAIPALASKFRFTAGEIQAATASARGRGRWHRPRDPRPTGEELYASCRAQSNPRLDQLARKIPPHHAWDDLVLGADGTRQLRDICGQVRHRARVLDEWGFERKLALGKGLAALFSGPSGTGKTMAAGIIARELGLDLYKIDLSGVVSKYIGETEKNLARVFGEAEATSAILFFDEADALFGKRSEVKDAHDRYANVETSYLLQRMEEYDGISILATNLRRNMDEAFVRRIAFVVQFPLPEEPERLRIWRGALPDAMPRDGLDLPFMARQFKLAGGNIKNIALAAAFLAAADKGVLTMRHVVGATRRELQKMGRSPAPAEFGAYQGLLEG